MRGRFYILKSSKKLSPLTDGMRGYKSYNQEIACNKIFIVKLYPIIQANILRAGKNKKSGPSLNTTSTFCVWSSKPKNYIP